MALRPLTLEFMEWIDGIENWKILGRKYKTSTIWEIIQPKLEKVDWHRLLWGSYIISKFAFIAWMAILNGMPTMDRLQAWGMEVIRICVLYKQDIENRNHLFFGCNFSQYIWKKVLELCGLRKEVCG